MFNKIFILLLISLFFLPQMVNANVCGIEEGNVDSLFDFYKTNCGVKTGDDLCHCLKTQANTNDLLAGLFNSKADVKIEKEEFVSKQTARLFNVYKQMTYGATYQKLMFGLDVSQKVGCPAENISKSYAKGIEDFTNEKLNAEKAIELQKLAECNKTNSCDETKKKLKKIENELSHVDMIVADACGHLAKMLGAMADPNVESPAVKDLRKAMAWYLENRPGNEKIINEINETITKVKAAPKPTNLVLAPSSHCNAGDASMYYSSVMMAYQTDLQDYANKLKTTQAPVVVAKVAPPVENKEEALKGLVDSIKTFNDSVADGFKKKFNHVGQNSCYTFSEYKMLQSKPSDFLLDAISKEQNPTGFFQPTGNFTNKLEVEKLNYLKANPAIANTLSVVCADVQFPHGLKRFAGEVQGMNKAEKMRAYIKFMKKDVAELLKEEEVLLGQMTNCDNLGRNIAAVHLTDEPAPVPVYNTSNPLQMLSQQVLVCKTKELNHSATTNLAATLNSNPLYLIQNEKEDDKIDPDPDSDANYQNFLSQNCSGFAAFRENTIKKKCVIPEMVEECRMKFEDAASPETESLRASYFVRNTDSTLPQFNFGQNSGVNSVLTSSQHQSATSINDLDEQDSTVREHFNKFVAPTLKKSVLANRGEEEAYTQDVTLNRSVVSQSAAIPFAAPVSEANVSEPDWGRPVLPPVTAQTLSRAETAQFLPQTYPALSDTQKLQSLQEARANVASEGQKLVEATSDPAQKQKIIDDLKTSIDKFDKDTEQVQRTAQQTPSVSPVTSNVVGTSVPMGPSDQKFSSSDGARSGSISGVVGGQNMAAESFVKNQVSAEEKLSATLLKSKYAESEKEAGRGPASEVSDNLKIVIGPSISEAITPETELLSKLELEAGLFGDRNLIMDKVRTELKDRKVKKDENVFIQFYDKAKNEVLIVSVMWSNNQWTISQVPRKSLLSNLKMTLISQN